MTSPFTRKALAFLRALQRNNEREWFRARKADYEAHVRAPMIETLEWLARDLPAFAPDLVSAPKVSLFRIYRDTRFSANKAPLKTNAAAYFPPRGSARHAGAGLYFDIAPRGVWIGGGLYRPSRPDLQAIRAHIAAHHRAFHRVVTAPAFRRAAGRLDGARLTRVPRGYRADHPAAEYLRYQQFFAGRQFPADLACSPRFYPTLLRTFRALAPLVTFLNTPLRARQAAWDLCDGPRRSPR